MKTGAEYLHSNEKRMFDLAFSYGLVPLEFASTSVAKLSFASYDTTYFEQNRVGRANEPMRVRKLRTLDGNGFVINKLAGIYRNKGLDELAQLQMVREGIMSVFGSRPLIPEDYDRIIHYAKSSLQGRNLLSKHQDLVVPAKRGLLSRFGLMAHTDDFHAGTLVRLEMDIADHEQASTVYDLKTLAIYTGKLIQNELNKGKV